MNTGSWLLFAAFFWFSGYLQLKLLEPSRLSKLVYVPKWLFILFGFPKDKAVPATVMHARSVYLQLMGLVMAFYGLLIDHKIVKDPLLSGFLGFGFSMLLSGLVATYLYQKRPYLWQEEETNNDEISPK